ncbi:unnamed protein product, partial [Sphagnum jensenii]
DLHGNNFTGNIPNLNALMILQQFHQETSGVLLSEKCVKELHFVSFSCWSSYFRNEPSKFLLTNLCDMNVFCRSLTNNPWLTGPIPAEINNLGSLEILDLHDNNFNGTIPVFNPQGLQELDLSGNQLTGPIPNFGSMQWLQTIKLSGNQLSGLSPVFLDSSSSTGLANLTALTTLNLSMNNFGGPIDPASIFNPYSNLKVLDLSRNNFSGPLPDISLFSNSLQQLLDYSTYCLETPLNILQTNGQKNFCAQSYTSNNTPKVIIISTIVSGIVLALVIAITTCLFWRSRQRQRYLLLQLHERFAQHEVQPTIFGYAKLKVATRDFHPTMKLGEGSFGVVYKGIFANGVEVAIKQLFMKTQENIDEFLNEVVIISGVKHRNLVKLKGCCVRHNKRLLVYEYLENGDLADLLFGGQNNREVLFWPTRFNICLGIARGLHYLHDISEPRIIHRDIKASNILLNKKLQPKIADFGLAFLFPDDKSHISTMHVAGTRGYLAPEYATLGQLTTKVDVYSFGVLLLEIISGKKNIDHNLPLKDIYLVEKAWRLHREGNLINIVDQNLHLLNDETIQARRLLSITLLCLLNDGEKRPSMARVVAMLQGEVESEIVENDLALGRSNIKLPPSSLSSLESKLELSNISEGSETSSLEPNTSKVVRQLLIDVFKHGYISGFIYNMLNLIIVFNTCYFLTNGFRNLDNNNLNGTLYIGNISSLSRKLHNGIIDGHIQSLSLTKNDISCVAYNSSDIHDVIIVIIESGNHPKNNFAIFGDIIDMKVEKNRILLYFCVPTVSYHKTLAMWNFFSWKSGEYGPFFPMKDPSYRSKSYFSGRSLEKNFGSKRNPELFGPYNISKFQATLAKQLCYNGSMLGLPWASYRENLSHNLSVTPTISMCDKLIHHTDLSGNQLTGQIPNLDEITCLETVKLSGNQLDSTNGGTNGLRSQECLTILDLSNNNFFGPPPSLIAPFLQYLNLSMNKFDGPIILQSIFNYQTYNLTVLDLSQNNFNGTLPNTSFLSNSLQQLNLDNNNLSGTLIIDNILGLIIKFPIGNTNGHLKYLNITNNHISNVEYTSYDIIEVITIMMLENNSYCLGKSLQTDGQRCYCSQNCLIISGDNNKKNIEVILISTLVSGSIVTLVIVITIYLFWRNKRKQQYLLLQIQEKFAEFEVQPTIFGYNELKVATRDFHPTMKLGEGSFGVVYKGILANGIEVAIKQLLINNQQNIDEFLNEVVIITGVKHRNLVKLKGCCLRDNKRLLVYEYLENGDLAKVLFERNGVDISFWPTRFNICLGIAHGLFYLHEIAQPRIIHRDIKASNILLDKRLQPKIADFGLALLFADDKTHISTMHVAGTRGYLAPEYATCGQLTIKVDVYSFGVLILEIISGRKCIDHELPPNDTYLLEKAWRLHNEGNLIDIVDQTLHLCNDEMIQARQLLNIALLCLLNEGEKRPTMAHVVAMLQGEVESERVENELKLGKSIMKSIKTSFSIIRSTIEISSTSEGLESSSQLLSNDSNISVNQKKLNLSSMELNLVSST